MRLSMILLPPLPIAPLQHLQSLLLNLTPGQVLHNPIINILSIEHIRWQWVLIVDHVVRQVLVYLVVRGVIPFQFIEPTTWEFVVFLLDVFGRGALVLFYFRNDLAYVRLFYSIDLGLNLVPILPFPLRKHPRLLLKLQLGIKLILRVIIEPLAQKVKLPISPHRRIRHLTRRARKRDLLPVIVLNIVEALVDSVRWIEVQVDLGLDGPENFVTPADHVETWDWWVVADLLCVDRAAVDCALVGFT